MFKLFQKAGSPPASQWRRNWNADGLLVSQGGSGTHLADALLPAYLAQLQDDGYATVAGADLIIESPAG